jgi:hypothetical protein
MDIIKYDGYDIIISDGNISNSYGHYSEDLVDYFNKVYSKIKFRGIVVDDLSYYPYCTQWLSSKLSRCERPHYDPNYMCRGINNCIIERKSTDDIRYILKGKEPKIPQSVFWMFKADKIVFSKINEKPIKHYGSDHFAYYLDYHSKCVVDNPRMENIYRIKSYKVYTSNEYISGVWWSGNKEKLKMKILYQEC